MQYSFGTAVGLMKSVIAFALIFISNKLSAKYMHRAVF